MKASQVSLLKGLTSKLHPPVILTPTESNRLLETLKASFRNHLDVEYSPLSVNQAARPRHTSASMSFAERHAASVLTNPLLAASRTPVTDRRHGHPDTSTVRHPMEIFTDCVARGTATQDIARQCLITFRRALQAQSVPTRRAEIARWKAGTQVLQWLWASGIASNPSVPLEHALCKHVVLFLLSEKREDAVWDWISRLLAEHSSSTMHKENTPAKILYRLVSWKVQQYPRWLTPALESFLQATRLHTTPENKTRLLSPALHLLCDSIGRESLPNPTGLDKAVLEQFFGAARQSYTSQTGHLALEVSRLRLRHFGDAYLNEAMALMNLLDMTKVDARSGQYGTRVSLFLIQLAKSVQQYGSRAQAQALAHLFRKEQDEDKAFHESVLTKLAHRNPSLILDDLKIWCARMDSEPSVG